MSAQAESVGAVLARRLRELRKRRGLSQVALAAEMAKLGISVDAATISRTEQGSREATVPEAFAMAAALGVSPVSLFTPEEDDDLVAVTPAISLPAGLAVWWLSGALPLTPADVESYVSAATWGSPFNRLSSVRILAVALDQERFGPLSETALRALSAHLAMVRRDLKAVRNVIAEIGTGPEGVRELEAEIRQLEQAVGEEA